MFACNVVLTIDIVIVVVRPIDVIVMPSCLAFAVVTVILGNVRLN